MTVLLDGAALQAVAPRAVNARTTLVTGWQQRVGAPA
jgi:hypothetical protein